jgi:arylsulfatase A-like enzyme
MLGQHRISKGKYFPYEPSLRIPFIVSGPGIRKNAHVPDLVSLIDYAPTMLTLTGAQPSGRTPDGISLEPLLRDTGNVTRRSVLLSSGPQRGPNGTMLPQFDGVRSPHYSWWRYEDGFEEMYDLRRDPFQLTNVASKPAYANKRNKLIAEWERLRDCQGATCQVRAPGAI